VRYRDHARGAEEEVFGKAVFVCGGAINSTELLLRCRDDFGTLPNLSAALGRGYSGNGDFLAFAFDTAQPYEPARGPTITTAVIYDVGEGDLRSWFTLQDGGYPGQIGSLFQLLREDAGWLPALGNAVRDELERAARAQAAAVTAREVAEAARSAVFLAMGRDRANGTIELEPLTRVVRIRWDLPDNLPLYGAEERLVRDVVGALGGRVATTPPWRLLHQPVSVHNLGGCCMADEPAAGVTDDGGQVFGYPNLFVLDGACLPAATGVNPSHTIAAVAERNIERFVRRWRQDPAWAPPERAHARPVVDPVPKIGAGGTAPTSTRAIGLSFTETMKGFFVPATEAPADVAGYVAAEKAGQRANSFVQFTLTITAADLDRFLSDRAHAALAVGDVRASGLTPPEGSAVTHGVFNLFVETGSFYERKMLYSLPFVGSDGAAYLLDGYKEVKDHGHFDVWGSTSTLYTVIRRGRAHDAPVCAAGILRILIPDFMHQLTTFQTPGAQGPVERLEALGRFGSMFMGSLWDVFVKPLVK
jgi:cholesterol oxidase